MELVGTPVFEENAGSFLSKNFENRRDILRSNHDHFWEDNVGSTNSIPTELVECARKGDLNALDRLLNHYRNYLKLLAQTQISQRLRVRVSPSDLVQETLIDAYRNFNNFQGWHSGELAAWLRTSRVAG